ncbi:uridylate kinase [Ferroglobus placidus DSM 10642]|uniref:Uridylate kinase n=1 Tax=Ferroglobus placidus (strain DSM 10642 / AEDII12DO) TaxID=589924 RepID=D3RXP7_FERPA|nr:UMP kinase [Ferroglobus placidus]ADC65260.1 uridylate kinase [Ferroglobus placidus DSM 10642]
MMIVVSIGGSVLFSDIKAEKIAEYGRVFDEHSEKVAVVVGGGELARKYIDALRNLGGSEALCDYLGIEVTRINALLLAQAIKKAPKVIPKDFREVEVLLKNYDAVVMGGTFPGHTTDATAALLAEYVNAEKLMIATNVEGVYSEDPKLNPEAEFFERLSPEKLVEIVYKSRISAGSKSVVDLLAAKVIERSRIPTLIFKGTVENLRKALRGEKVGTEIV